MTKILMIEANERLDDCSTWKKSIEIHYIVETAINGQHAVEKCRRNKYDLIMLNSNAYSGEITRFCKSLLQTGNSNIFVISKRQDVAMKEAVLDAGASDYLPEPLDARELLARIRALLRRPYAASASAAFQVDRIQQLVQMPGQTSLHA